MPRSTRPLTFPGSGRSPPAGGQSLRAVMSRETDLPGPVHRFPFLTPGQICHLTSVPESCPVRKLIVRPELRRIVDGFLAVPDGIQPVQGAEFRGNARRMMNVTGTE